MQQCKTSCHLRKRTKAVPAPIKQTIQSTDFWVLEPISGSLTTSVGSIVAAANAHSTAAQKRNCRKYLWLSRWTQVPRLQPLMHLSLWIPRSTYDGAVMIHAQYAAVAVRAMVSSGRFDHSAYKARLVPCRSAFGPEAGE